MGTKTLSKREIKELSPQISSLVSVSPKQKVEIIQEDRYTILSVDDEPLLFRFEDKWLPLLRQLFSGGISPDYPRVTVDMGAVKFVANGADIMRPGITHVDDGISAGDPVLIVDEIHGKTLAIGVALFSSEEIRGREDGKVIRSAHAAGDRLWELTR
ncbi:MAG: DUF1947 domain-containing protein [Candidatus Micrarchaeia archaeon]